MRRTRLSGWLALFIAAGCLLLVAGRVHAQAVTQAYTSDAPLQRGMSVRITDVKAKKVVAVTASQADRFDGVVIAANDAPVTLTNPDSSQQQIFVARSGNYNLLVSNQNGVIHKNDYLAVSALDGVAMKADSRQPYIIGRALADYSGGDSASGTASLRLSSGKTKTVSIGLLAADISGARNPLARQLISKIPGLAIVQSAADNLTGKPVDPARLYVSLVVLLVVAAIAGSILYGGVRSAIVSIGRNPLAKPAIIRGLVQVVLVSLIVFIIGLFGIYLILKL